MSRRRRRLAGAPGEPHPEALFRYGLVCQVLTRTLDGKCVSQAAGGIASQPHHDSATGEARRVSPRTLRRWHKGYRNGDFSGLVPKQRKKATGPVVLSDELVTFCREEKNKDPRASVPELCRRAQELGILKSGEVVDRSTLWRTLTRMGVSTRRRKAASDRDSRRYAFPHRLNCVLCDGKYFRAGAAETKRMALNFLDDANRSLLHVLVGASENTEIFLRGVYEVIARYGYMDLLYVDHGPGFISLDTLHVFKHNLKIPLIHGEAAYPEGHGKVERFNQTFKQDLLRHWRGRPDIDPAYAALEARLEHYRRTQYNCRPHESLGKRTPWECFEQDPKPLKLPANDELLRSQFVIHEKRRVSNDHIVSVDGAWYEMPRGYAGCWVTIERHLLRNNRIFFLHEGELIELHVVDLEKNARAKRAKEQRLQSEDDHPLPKSAAEHAYERDMAPMVDADGGYAGSEEDE